MTNIGIAFVNAQETIRSNRAQEEIKREANRIEAFKAVELQRHNQVTEEVSMRDVAVKERAQSLDEQRYFNIEIPESQSRIAVNYSQVALNAAKEREAYASAQLKSTQVGTELAKQSNLAAQTTLYTASAKKATAEAKKLGVERNYLNKSLESRVSYTNMTQNTFTGIRDAILPVGEFILKGIKTYSDAAHSVAAIAGLL